MLTHARRRFDAALTALKKDFNKKEQLKETVAYQAMSRIGILYKIEGCSMTKHRKKNMRSARNSPVRLWTPCLNGSSPEDSVDRSSLIGDAILYTLNQEVYLRRYLEDGHLSIDNNSAERALKNFAVDTTATGCLPKVYGEQMPVPLFTALQKRHF